jgi:hypothetical protein
MSDAVPVVLCWIATVSLVVPVVLLVDGWRAEMPQTRPDLPYHIEHLPSR